MIQVKSFIVSKFGRCIICGRRNTEIGICVSV
jgi:hypothetical protein